MQVWITSWKQLPTSWKSLKTPSLLHTVAPPTHFVVPGILEPFFKKTIAWDEAEAVATDRHRWRSVEFVINILLHNSLLINKMLSFHVHVSPGSPYCINVTHMIQTSNIQY